MSTTLKVLDREIELTPFVEEAVRALGYVDEGAIPWLTSQIAEYGNRNNGRSIRSAGSRLDKAARVDRGLPATGEPLSLEVWNVLTAEGRLDPVNRFDNTCWRALNAARRALTRERDLQSLQTMSAIIKGVRFLAAPQDPCPPASALDQQTLREPPHLPLSGCDRDACACSWRTISKFEIDRRE